MAWDYGFGELVNQLIEIFDSHPHDYVKAEELIKQGIDLNAISNNGSDELILTLELVQELGAGPI